MQNRRCFLKFSALGLASLASMPLLGCGGGKKLIVPSTDQVLNEPEAKLARRPRKKPRSKTPPTNSIGSSQAEGFPPLTNDLKITKAVLQNGVPTFYLSNGTTINDINTFFEKNDRDILSSKVEIPVFSPPKEGSNDRKFYHLGQYWWDIRWEKDRVTSKCFDRWDQWHLNIHLKKKNPDRELFNFHLLWWQENGRWCFGIYESASKWCWSKCSVTWDDLKNAFSSAIKAGSDNRGIYLSWTTAVALATALMLLLFAAA